MNIQLLLCLLLLSSSTAIVYREFRIPLPFTLEECRVGHRWSTAQYSLLNTGGGEGVEIVTNEPFERDSGAGQFTHKIFYFPSKIPEYIRWLAPKGSLEIYEKSWNSFPFVETEISNQYMKEGFHISIYSMYVENDDCTKKDNIFRDIYNGSRRIINIDIVNDAVAQSDYSEDGDPGKCQSDKLSLGPLTQDWKTKQRQMCVYKLVEAEFKWFGLQPRVESLILKMYTRLFRLFHRDMFCWADQWADLTMSQIREFEELTKTRLDLKRRDGDVVGFSEQ